MGFWTMWQIVLPITEDTEGFGEPKYIILTAVQQISRLYLNTVLSVSHLIT